MQRLIIGFGQDDLGDPVAYLDCGHPQHVRHKPPFFNREWALTAAGRQSRLGQPLNCIRCEQFEWPEQVVAFQQTPVFTETNMPPALRRDHATKTGIWGKIVVQAGTLRYHVPALKVVEDLTAEKPGIVVPNVKHWVAPLGPVRFYVALYRLA